MIARLGATIDRILVTEVREHTYFAELHLTTGGNPLVVSARPSDAVALAVRIGCPIFATEEVLEAGGQPEDTDDGESGDGDGHDEAQILAEFQDFIAGVSPDDFAE